MAEAQIFFPMEPKEFWQKLKTIVEQVVIEHNSNAPLFNSPDANGQRHLLKANDVCAIFRISKPTLYEWMSQGKIASIKIESRRFFRWEDVEKLIEENRVAGAATQKGVGAPQGS
jgi:predicted DNA-binding transcriptional regulator AlpA